MPSYSADEFYQDWRYAIDEEFSTHDGHPFPYADDGHRHWGDEIKKLEFGQLEPQNSCVSSDGKRLAVAVVQDIYIFDTESWTTLSVLRGHVSSISSMAFKPHDPNILVSSGAEPVIIVWNISEYEKQHANIRSQATLEEVSSAAATGAVLKLKEKGVAWAHEWLYKLEQAIAPAVKRIVTEELVGDQTILHGRLRTSFQSNIFSPSGQHMVYLPGRSPKTNSVDVWDMTIISADDFKSNALTLSGHTDGIMWTGWNRDESLFASVAWDETIRIWDPATGQQKFCFTTTLQNWAGEFSPDSRYFAATCGSGATYIYNMVDGTTVWVYEREANGWRRALAWHPNGKWLAVGGEECAPLVLLDVEKQEILQKRTLSARKSRVDGGKDEPVLRRMVGGCLSVSRVRFVDDGNKIAIWIQGDCSIEVFDLVQEVKWRFARGGTEDEVDNSIWRDEKGTLKVSNGHGMTIWEDHNSEQLMLASVDCDAVRIWSIQIGGSAFLKLSFLGNS